MRLTFFGSGPNPGRALLFAVAALSTAAPGCSGCEEPTDEQAIRALVAEAVAASERNDVGALMDCATDDFQVDPGGADRREVKAALLLAFRRYGKLSVEHPTAAIDVAEGGRTAALELPFLVVREGAEAPALGALVDDPERWFEEVAEQGDAFFLELALEKTDDGWRASRAKLRGTRDRWSL